MTDTELLAEFIQSFELLDDLLELEPVPPELRGNNDGSFGRMVKWKPARIQTDAAALVAVYNVVPGPFPPLYEQLVLSYRWLEVHLKEIVCLHQNTPADSLMPLLKAITGDRILTEVLLPQGFIPFGKAAEAYDPICFDTRRRGPDGDCPIVRFEHESILCNGQIGESWIVAGSFRILVERVIATAAGRRDT